MAANVMNGPSTGKSGQPGDSSATSEPTILPATAVPLPTPTAVPSPTPTAFPATASPSPAPKPTVLRITYFNDGLTVWTEGSGSRKLADADVEQARISDDGQVVAYLSRNSQGIHEIFAVNADGSNQRVLVGQDYLQNIEPAGQVVLDGLRAGQPHALFRDRPIRSTSRKQGCQRVTGPSFRGRRRGLFQLFAGWPMDDPLSS